MPRRVRQSSTGWSRSSSFTGPTARSPRTESNSFWLDPLVSSVLRQFAAVSKKERVNVQAGRPRAGRRFQPIREKELSADALRAAQSLPNAHRGLRIILETAGPFGVPDLVAVVGPLDLLDRRLA